MDFSTNDSTSRELSTNELDTISAGFRCTGGPLGPFGGLGPALPPPIGGGGGIERPHPGLPPYEVF